MNKKQKFIEFFKELLDACHSSVEDMPEGARLYWEALQSTKEIEKPMFTDNGKLILQYLQDNPELGLVRSKDIAEGLFISSRTVSGAIRKLVTDGFVEKMGQDPVVYTITEKGRNIEIK